MSHQTLTYLKQRFQQVGLKLQSRHGQNFLIDLNLLRILADSAQLSPHDVVLEVGTGVGSLTALVAPQVAHLVTVEIDPRLAQLASEELLSHANITLLQMDALRRKHEIDSRVLGALRQHLAAEPQRNFKLVANLPYGVATPLISNLLELEWPPVSMTITIQKELADRLAAQPHTKDYGAISVWVQCQCRVEILRVMPPTVFWPRPKVHSAIVHITLEPERRSAIPDRRFFHEFVRKLFLHRRKFLRGVLVATYKDRLDKPAIDRVLSELQFGGNARAEELSVEQMLALCEKFRQIQL
ncbi:MAG TPA: 16S rRNA (adenine(1518)-N(6)/adenine(1519)-N(6))-dimethyltransferase RsmA [Pirellulales bacterium]|jgi:16S rRNA (adenine1518-N6/adenine1519-N6)-dimethyltransferase|nr:16S rRNA (adenine(1518)-N(6)/adenine(1519)-N(6))-dimethyltransferase RsmA [Pirellulales bacterium]